MKRVLFRLALLSLLILPGSCSSGGDDDVNVRFSLTDAPTTSLQAVNVTIASVRVHQSASAAGSDAGWREIPVTAPMPVDLMTLRGGVLYDLCGANLEAGDYQQVRLVMTANGGAEPPYRNSVMTMDGVLHPIDVPTESVKISHSFTVAAGTTTDIVLDFDAAQSCRQRGDESWLMEPWITASSSMR